MTGRFDDVCQMAINLARNCRYAVFPCKEDKTPACPHWPENASKDPQEIAHLWRRSPGPLIGVATGAMSGIDVIDIDNGKLRPDATAEELKKRDAAAWWWRDNHHRIPRTRAYASQRNGVHLYLKHVEGMRNGQGRINRGVDVRADGGYIIHWFAAGKPCLDHETPADWPRWLVAAATRPPIPQISRYEGPITAAVDGIVRRVAEAQIGERNALAFWAACRLFERGMSRAEVEALLLPAAAAAGLTSGTDQIGVRRSIASAAAHGEGRAA